MKITTYKLKYVINVMTIQIDGPWWASALISDRLTRNNGGQYRNLKRAHKELQNLISLAIETAKNNSLPLSEIEIECPALMDMSCWCGYFGAAWDKECNARKLEKWFKNKYGDNFEFHIDARGVNRTVIDFSPKAGPKKHD